MKEESRPSFLSKQEIESFIQEEINKQLSEQSEKIPNQESSVEKFSTKGQTGPIDVPMIRALISAQNRQNQLNAKQKEKHEQLVTKVNSEPIRLRRLIRSFKFALQGFIYVWKTQPNMKVHTIAAVLAILLGFLFRISVPEWLSLILVIGLVIMLEVINTAIETLVDLYTEDFSFLAGVSKDLGATTVMIIAFTSVIVGGIIFLPKILALIQELAL